MLMTALIAVSRSAATFLLAATLGAQSPTPAAIQKLLPLDAKIVETADLTESSGKPRALVLWMRHPERVVRQEAMGCVDWVYGDHWYGPTRVSLVDLSKPKLINTVEIRGLYAGTDDKERSFPVPFFVSNSFYYVPLANAKKEGQPMILYLRDLTGEGVAGQFVLFEY